MILILISKTNIRRGSSFTLRVTDNHSSTSNKDTKSLVIYPPLQIEPNSTLNKKEVNQVGLVRKVLNSTLNITKALITLGIFSYLVVFKIPGSQKIENETYRVTGVQPSPHKTDFTEKTINGLPIDHFVSNYQGFEKIEEAILRENVNVHDLNLNKNKYLFDTSIEIKKLINELKLNNSHQYQEEIKLLEEIDTICQLIWGPNGPHHYNTEQGARPNCQVTGAIQSQWLTEEGIQNVKGKTKVTSFNPGKENFQLEIKVEFGGEIVTVTFKDLVIWLSPKDILPTTSTDGTLSCGILSLALEKGLENYTGVPNISTSAPLTLITGQNSLSVFVDSLSDDELIRILSKAPNTPVLLNTRAYFAPDSISLNKNELRDYIVGSFNDIFNFVREENTGSTKTNLNNPTSVIHDLRNKEEDFSEYKARKLLENLYKKLDSINSDNNSTNLTETQQKRRKYSRANVAHYHTYVVKDFKKVNDEYIATLIDSHNKEIDLNLKDIRKYIRKITTESQNLPNFGTESTKATLISLLLIAAILLVSHKLNIKLDPNYKSSLITTGNKLLKRLKRVSS